MHEYFTELQPKEGDVILHCEHTKSGHFFSLTPDGQGQEFTRPDGTKGIARWLTLCDDCFEIYKRNPVLGVTGESEWVGNKPIITRKAN